MIDTLSKIYQFSGKMQGTMKKTILFSVLHSLFDVFWSISPGVFGFNRRFYYFYDLDDIWNHFDEYDA